MKIVAIVALILLLACTGAAYFISASDYFWRPIPASIELNGHQLGTAHSYRSAGSADVMVSLAPGDIYVIRSSRNTVGVTSERYFWFVTRYGAMAKSHPDPSVDMKGPKVEIDPQLQITSSHAQFRTMKGAQVQVSW